MKSIKGFLALICGLFIFALVSFVTDEPITKKSESAFSLEQKKASNFDEIYTFESVYFNPEYESKKSFLPSRTQNLAAVEIYRSSFLPVDVGKIDSIFITYNNRKGKAYLLPVDVGKIKEYI